MTINYDLARYTEASHLLESACTFGDGICIMRDLSLNACGPIRERARKRLEIRVPEQMRNDWQPEETA